MKKLLAAVLAVALVAVGVVVGTHLAPVAAPEDDGAVVPVANVTEPAADDKAPADDAKTAVLAGYDDDQTTGNGEPAALSDPTDEGTPGDDETNSNDGSGNTNPGSDNSGDPAPAGGSSRNQGNAADYRQHDVTPNDTVGIDAKVGFDNDSVYLYAENNAGSIQVEVNAPD